ncbi:hypothetical protein A4X09_0g5781 [Tilletia walkeri]|uniref:DUF1348-domain-containing protein n=1 Tax=Tilletia walkeri TaxID=117179 RepID=A0A8X7N3V7_9BASI|nr:hypothetical protein A4X09_0g5781 [Tilletia walkeri]
MSAAPLVPPFTAETAHAKVKKAQALWNTQDPEKIAPAYTEDSIWRNRDQFFTGHIAIKEFLTNKWRRERRYRLKKELFCWNDNKIAVQFWYEYEAEPGKWRRCYGLEDWTFAPDGRMAKRQMSGNEIEIAESERWFKDDITEEEIDAIVLGDRHH